MSDSPQNNWKVFICHANKDKGIIVSLLVKALKKLDTETWYDEKSILPGKFWDDQVHQGLEDCQGGIIIITKAFLDENPAAENVRMAESFVLAHGLYLKKIFFLMPLYIGIDPENDMPRKYAFLRRIIPKKYGVKTAIEKIALEVFEDIKKIKNDEQTKTDAERKKEADTRAQMEKEIREKIKTEQEIARKTKQQLNRLWALRIGLSVAIVAIVYFILTNNNTNESQIEKNPVIYSDTTSKAKTEKEPQNKIPEKEQVKVEKEPQNELPKKEKEKATPATINQYEIKAETHGPISPAFGNIQGNVNMTISAESNNDSIKKKNKVDPR
jgi:hypothetical protein